MAYLCPYVGPSRHQRNGRKQGRGEFIAHKPGSGTAGRRERAPNNRETGASRACPAGSASRPMRPRRPSPPLGHKKHTRLARTFDAHALLSFVVSCHFCNLSMPEQSSRRANEAMQPGFSMFRLSSIILSISAWCFSSHASGLQAFIESQYL